MYFSRFDKADFFFKAHKMEKLGIFNPTWDWKIL